MKNESNSTPTLTALPLLGGLIVLLAAGLAGAAQQLSRGSCAEFADYADELVPTDYQILSQTDVGDGVVRVELGFDLENLDGARFRDATASLVLDEGCGEYVLEDPPPIAASFGNIAPNGTAAQLTPLVVYMDTTALGALEDARCRGALVFAVKAFEVTVLAEGVEVHEWSALEERHWVIAEDILGIPQTPHDPPYGPNEEFTFSLIETFDGFDNLFDEFDPGERFYVVEDRNVHELEWLPDVLRNVRVVDVQKSDESGDDDGVTTWQITVARTENDVLRDLVESGSFCTGTSAHVDWPVQATRLQSLDGVAQEAEARDSFSQPIRFNQAVFMRDSGGGGAEAEPDANASPIDADVTISGQVQGHVMKPTFELRLRPGKMAALFDLENELSMSAELVAHASVAIPEQRVSLFDLCFPLPDLLMGPISVPMTLQVDHSVGLNGDLQAGLVVGLQKSWINGVTMGCDGSLPEGSQCGVTPYNDSTPLEFTPPRLTEESGLGLKLDTTIRTSLRIGSAYPLCDIGGGAHLAATGYGTLDVRPAQDPWWQLGHGFELEPSIDLNVFGLRIFSDDTGRIRFEGPELLDSLGTSGGGAGASVTGGEAAAQARASGEDQRWAIAVDDIDLPGGVQTASVAALSDASAIATWHEDVTSRNHMARFDRFGALQWNRKFNNGLQPKRVVILPNDTILIGGLGLWFSLHDASGDVITSLDMSIGAPGGSALEKCSMRDITWVEDGEGHFDVVLVGRLGRGDIRQRDACAVYVDVDGATSSVRWARIYEDAGAQTFLGVTATSDGHLVVVGETKTGPDPQAFDNPLIAKLDLDGDLVWNVALPMTRGAKLNAVAESDDGALVAVGVALATVTETGSALAARIDADGSDPQHALLFQDEAWEQQLDFEPYVDTAAGTTAWDEFFAITKVHGGFVVVGKTGIASNPFEVEGHAAWIAKLNARLGVEWYTTLDAFGSEQLHGVHKTTDGLLAAGWSRALDTVGNPGESHFLLVKLPFTGAVELLPGYETTTRFVEPGIRFSSADLAIVREGSLSMTAPLAIVDAEVASAQSITDPFVAPSRLCVTRLTESGRDSVLDDCGDDADADGVPDDLDNCPEAANGPLAGPNDQADVDRDGTGDVCECSYLEGEPMVPDGDANRDGLVNGADYTIWADHFGDPDPSYLTGDFNCDGKVDGADYTIWADHFGEGFAAGVGSESGGAAASDTPATPRCGLGPELAFLVLLLRRRRSRSESIS